MPSNKVFYIHRLSGRQSGVDHRSLQWDWRAFSSCIGTCWSETCFVSSKGTWTGESQAELSWWVGFLFYV